MSDPIPALEPDVLAILETARPPTEARAAVKARVLSSLEARIAALPSGGGQDGGGGADEDGGHGDGGASGGDGGAAPNAGAGASAGASASAGWVATHPFLALGIAFAIGGAVGAVARQPTHPAERIFYVDRIATGPSATATAIAPVTREPAPSAVAVESLPAAPLAAAAAASPAAPGTDPSPTPAPADSGEHLRAESALLDAARTAVARGESDQALASVQRHEASFPRGLLREEREALAIRALVLAGRGEEARTRNVRFRAAYPSSVFLPAVDSSLRTLPR